MRPAPLLVCALVLLAVLPASAAAAAPQTDTRIVVERGETVDGLTAAGGVVVVRGTVEGNLEAYGGRVVITESGTVTGRVRAGAGVVVVNGTVGDTVVAYGGRVVVGESAQVKRSVGALADRVVIAGEVGGDVTAGARRIVLANAAVIHGDLNYDGNLVDEGGTVEGNRRATSDLGLVPSLPIPGPVRGVYWLLANAMLGAVLLLAFPRYSWAAANTASVEPLKTGAVGLAAVLAIPITLLLVALTIVGIPLAVVGAAGFFALVWAGSVLGRFAIGTWLLSLADREHRWGALALGLAVVAVLARLPYLGLLVQAVALLLGVGVAALGLRAAYGILRDHPGGVTSL